MFFMGMSRFGEEIAERKCEVDDLELSPIGSLFSLGCGLLLCVYVFYVLKMFCAVVE